ncbi:MAG: 4a-hydroxytetrahydrobiopterin dehydratase [Betaproteobacteria bacterium]
MTAAAPRPARSALGPTEIVTRLTQLNAGQVPGWRLIDGALEKTFGFPDFHRTMGFANAVAFIANAADHHPDLQLSYGHCTVRFVTHDVQGITVSDFSCAAQVDALLD